MLNVAFKSLLSHKLRMFLTTASIVLGVAFVSGTYVFTDSISKTFNNLFTDVFSSIDLTVRSTEENPLGSSYEEKYVEVIKSTEGVRVAEAAVNSLFAQYIGKDGKPIGGNGPPTLGFSWTTEDELNVLRIEDGNGRPPEKAGEVVMDANTAKQNGFSVGDKVQIQTLGPVQEFEVVGIASFGEADSLAGATLAAFEFEQAQELFKLQGRVSEVSLLVADGYSLEAVQASLKSELPAELEVVTGQEQTDETLNEINQGLGFINIALLAFAGIALFVGAYIIQNTFRIVVAQRSKELSLLRAIGATRLQIVATVVYEALFVGIIASALGILAGIGIASAIRALGNSAGLALPEGDLAVLPRTIIVSMAVGVIVTVISALLPAIKASRLSPVEGLRDIETSASGKSLVKRGVISGIVAGIGIVLLLVGLYVDDLPVSPLYLVGGGIAVLFLGVSAFAPLLSDPLGKLIGWPFVRTRGMPAHLAQLNVGRTPRRTASTASALMIGVSLVTLVTIFASSANATVDEVVAENFPADVIALPKNIQTPNPVMPAQFGEDLSKLDEVQDVSRIKYDFVTVNESPNQYLGAIDPATFDKTVKIFPTVEFSVLDDGNNVIVRDSTVSDNGWKLGDKINIKFSNDKVLQAEIVGTYSGEFDTPYIISRSLYGQFASVDNTDTFVSANYREGIEISEAESAVNSLADKYPTVNVQNQDELVQQSKDQINQILGLIWGLLGFAIIIAVLGITNTLALSIFERKRELGLLRAVGMSKKQMRSMVRIESIIISLFGAVLGVIMGIFFARALLKALEDEGLTAFDIPYSQIIILFVLAALAGVLASIWPAYSAARVKILDAIKFE